MKRTQSFLAAEKLALGSLLSALVVLTSCNGGSSGDKANRGPFTVTQISTGLGQIYPYRIRRVDTFGNPTATILNVDSMDVLKANVNANNDVLPVATFDTTATLPNGQPGNQFVVLRFSHKLRVNSILSDQLSGLTNSGLTTAVSLVAYNPATETTAIIQGRGFVGGYTYYNRGGRLVEVQAVTTDSNGVVQILDPEATGFPRGFTGDTDLVEPGSFVFVADADNNLNTFETFPTSMLLRMIISNAVRDTDGRVLGQEVCTATTVGSDPNPPNVLGYTTTTPDITPANGEANVDPTTTILVRFNKPVKPGTVGTFLDRTNLTPAAGGVTIGATIGANAFTIAYYADPLNFGDMCNFVITPSYVMPGELKITFTVQNTRVQSLNGQLIGQVVSSAFTTGQGPGIVNAPVSPDTIYVGIGGADPGLSVIDLNGLGQGTGTQAETRFPFNPNIGQPGVTPPLAPGTSTLDYGSSGALTLTKDSAGRTRLLRAPTVGQILDVHIGCPLDMVFNNENINVNASKSNQTTPVGSFGPGNTIMVAPHPNPPRLVFPPPNPGRAIFGEEPTVTTSTPGPPGAVVTLVPPCSVQPINLLVAGNPFSNIKGNVGLYGNVMMGVFYGPQPAPNSPPPPPAYCPFNSRQQVGHFLYALDRDNRQVLVLNSNRMTILDAIKLSDPVAMGMSPKVNRLAVANFASSSVSFIDINPLSPTFNTKVAETRVETGPTRVARQPEGDDVFVVSTGSNAVTILSGVDYSRRKVITGFLNNPLGVAITERNVASGNLSGVYYAYILNANGTVAVYESGPDGTNGIGFNDIIGTVPNIVVARPRVIRLDWQSQQNGFMIGHLDENGLGQISKVELTSGPIGAAPITQNQGGFQLVPTFRQKEWTVTQRFGGFNPSSPVKDTFSGNTIIDIAYDDMYNFGALPDAINPFIVNQDVPPMNHSGKSSIKTVPGGVTISTQPKLQFIALSDTGRVDIFEYGTGRKIKTLDMPGVSCVSNYWRQ